MARIYIDGGAVGADFANGFVAQRVVTFPFPWPNNGDVKETVLTYQRYTNLATTVPLAYGSASGLVPGAVLTAKGPITPIGGGISQYDLTYTETPAAWNEKQLVAYTFPGLSGGIGPNWSPYYYRPAVTLYSVANVHHEFAQGINPPTPLSPFIVTDNGNVCDYIGTSNPNFAPSLVTNPSVEPINYIVSGDIAAVRPTIWENTTVSVQKPV